MTAQVEGTEKIVDLAHQAGNWDVTIRTYPIANHVLRLGDEANSGTPFADAYVDDVVDWAVGTTHGLKQTSERVAGTRNVPVNRSAIGPQSQSRPDHLPGRVACQHAGAAACRRRAVARRADA